MTYHTEPSPTAIVGNRSLNLGNEIGSWVLWESDTEPISARVLVSLEGDAGLFVSERCRSLSRNPKRQKGARKKERACHCGDDK
jgi:hypothetical protein